MNIESLTAQPPTGYCRYCSNPDVGFYVIHYGHCPKLHEIFIQIRQEESFLIEAMTRASSEALYAEFFL